MHRSAGERAGSAAACSGVPAVTGDVVAVLAGANLARVAPIGGANLVELLRAEFLFRDRAEAPGVAEQEARYRAVAAAAGRRITLRTVAVGGDKPLPYHSLPAGAARSPTRSPANCSPPSARRTRRRCRSRPDGGRARRAVHRAPGPLRRHRDGRAGTPRPGLQVGFVIEVPAAALKAAAFAPSVDFFSIGTNDLTQYTPAAERGIASVAGLADAVDPGVLRLVDAVCRPTLSPPPCSSDAGCAS
jgi:multiphosphoryl transfer protein